MKNIDELETVLSKTKFNSDCIILTEVFQIDDVHCHKLDDYNAIYNYGDINKNDGALELVYLMKLISAAPSIYNKYVY